MYKIRKWGTKTLNGRRAPRCDKHRFRASNDGEHLNRLQDIVVEHSGLNKKERKKERILKMAFSLLHTFAFRKAFGQPYESC